MLDYQTIRQVLRHWDSLKALGQHPLTELRIVEDRHRTAGYTASPAGKGLALREVLKSALEQLNPGDDSGQKNWRPYTILTEQYVNGRSPQWIVAQLHISHGTYFSEQKRALELVAELLQKWEEECAIPPAAAPAEPPSPQKLIPFLVPPRPAQPVVGHNEILAKVTQCLLNGHNGAAVALNGLPGVGKTTLAIELAHHPQLIDHFSDGILWIGLGRQPDLPALLGTWAAAVDLPAETIAGYGIAERAAAIRAVIGLKRMLLVIDDAWQVEAALAFKVGGPNCAHVMTTRLANVALDFAGDQVIKINELELNQGLNLLGHFTPRLVETAPDEATKLVRSVGGLPLALILMGGYLRKQSYNAQNRRVYQALTELQTAETRLRLSRPQSPVEAHPSLSFETPLSLQAIIGMNDAHLNPTARQSLRDLSLFEPKPNTFTEAAALAVIGGSSDDLDQLVDHGLLESVAPEHYTIHQTIADYAALEGPSPEAIERMVRYFVEYVQKETYNFSALKAELTNLVTALDLAAKTDAHLFARGVTDFYPFLETQGLYSLAERLLLQAAELVATGDNQTDLAETWLTLGDLAVRQGNFKNARIYLQKSVSLGRQLGLKLIEAKSLFHLGLSCWYMAGDAGGTADMERALHLYRELGYKDLEGYALTGLGFIYQETDNYERATTYFMQALKLGQDVHDPRIVGWAHFNLGQVDLLIGEFERAKNHLDECLRLYRQIGDRRGEGWLLYNLVRYYRKTGDYNQAKAINEQALEILIGIGERFGQGFTTHNQGLLLYEMGHDAEAMAHYNQAMIIFQEMDCFKGLSQVNYSYGVRLRHYGNYAGAQHHFEQALRLRQTFNYKRGESMALVNLGLIFHYQGNDQSALLYSNQALGIVREIGAKPTLAYILTLHGEILAGMGRLTEAAATFQQVIDLWRGMGQPHLALDALAGLAEVFLAQNNLPQAATSVAAILPHLHLEQFSSNQNHTLTGADNPAKIYRVCHTVLAANGDARAEKVLRHGHILLQTRAATIKDEALRRGFLEQAGVTALAAGEYSHHS